MHSIDVLYYSLAIAALAFAGSIVYMAIYFVRTLQSLHNILDDMADVSEDIRDTKDFLKKDVLAKLFRVVKDFFSTTYEQRTKTGAHSS